MLTLPQFPDQLKEVRNFKYESNFLQGKLQEKESNTWIYKKEPQSTS